MCKNRDNLNPHKSGSREWTRARAAFTLMELLIVMGIMGFMTAVVTASYFGMTRAASYNASAGSVTKMLQLARQRANIDGSPVHVIIKDKSSYVLVGILGNFTGDMKSSSSAGAMGEIHDIYTDLNEFTDDTTTLPRIWNLGTEDTPKCLDGIIKRVRVRDNVFIPNLFNEDYSPLTTVIEFKSYEGNWDKGDRYGFEIFPEQTLPKGFNFGNGSATALTSQKELIFYPDGTVSEDIDLYLFETLTKGEAPIIVKVRKDGSISI